MKAEKDDGCRCPRCHDHIPEQFYCRNCGYVPDWRQRASEEHEGIEGSGVASKSSLSHEIQFAQKSLQCSPRFSMRLGHTNSAV